MYGFKLCIYYTHNFAVVKEKIKDFWEKAGEEDKMRKIRNFVLKTGRFLGGAGRLLGEAGMSSADPRKFPAVPSFFFCGRGLPRAGSSMIFSGSLDKAASSRRIPRRKRSLAPTLSS